MAVYVDDMYKSSMGQFGRMKMSHMMADTLDELNEMADKIGVNRRWIQHAHRGKGWVHYDVSLGARKIAVQNFAVEMTMREMAAMAAKWRAEVKPLL